MRFNSRVKDRQAMIDLSWDEVQSIVDDVAARMAYVQRNYYDPFGDVESALFIGVSRGGVIPAAMLSHACIKEGMKNTVEYVTWQRLDGQVQHVPDHVCNLIADGRTTYIIDDINDSGRSLETLLKYLEERCGPVANKIHTTVLLEKVQSQFIVDFCGTRLDDERWIKFPWEK